MRRLIERKSKGILCNCIVVSKDIIIHKTDTLGISLELLCPLLSGKNSIFESQNKILQIYYFSRADPSKLHKYLKKGNVGDILCPPGSEANSKTKLTNKTYIKY